MIVRSWQLTTSSSSIRGMSINMFLYLDEFAFVEDAETFYTATYVITSGKDSKVIITSTANGVGNMFHKIYESVLFMINLNINPIYN